MDNLPLDSVSSSVLKYPYLAAKKIVEYCNTIYLHVFQIVELYFQILQISKYNNA